MANLPPYLSRDFRQGRYTDSAVSTYLNPKNSVNDCKNVNFDTVIGNGVVRPGTTKLGATVNASKTPLGMYVFVKKGGATTYPIVVYQDSASSNSTIVYKNVTGTWSQSNLTSIGNFKVRFETFGNLVFLTSGSQGMNSSPDANTWNGGATYQCLPSADARGTIIKRYKGRLLAGGDSTYQDRVYFSSIIDPAATPFITWNSDNSTGDWIDVNPDDGGYLTGFSETSTFLLVFKNNGMYRMDTVAKSVDPENIFNVGAVSQEAITLCQGITYFFSGTGIWRTNGGFPELISRAGVQDVLDAISQSDWENVYSWTDYTNVYFSVGDVTLNADQDDEKTISNCVLKFSPNDQNWSLHSYANRFYQGFPFTNTNGTHILAADTDGNVQYINKGTTDNGSAINYEIEMQEIDFGNRAHLKGVADQLVVFTKNGQDSSIACLCDGKIKKVQGNLTDRVNYVKDINLIGHYFAFKWYGQSMGKAPVFEGIYIENITDQGLTNG